MPQPDSESEDGRNTVNSQAGPLVSQHTSTQQLDQVMLDQTLRSSSACRSQEAGLGLSSVKIFNSEQNCPLTASGVPSSVQFPNFDSALECISHQHSQEMPLHQIMESQAADGIDIYSAHSMVQVDQPNPYSPED